MKNAMILTAVISAIFAVSSNAKTLVKNSVETEQENHIPWGQKCSYENNELWVQDNYYCEEGVVVGCPNLLLVIVNKKTGDFNYMRGEHIKLGNQHFHKYIDNKKYEYYVPNEPDDDNSITIGITKNNGSKFIKEIKLYECDK